jgi:hypothetical protein
MRCIMWAALAAVGMGCGPSAGPTPAESLSWLEGTWTHQEGELTTEERWVETPDGRLLGAGRVTVDGKLGFAETLAISVGQDGLVLTAWPAGKDPVRFAEETRDAASVTFGNPDNDFPKRLSYRVQDDQKLSVRATGKGPAGPRNETWTLEKQTPPGG